MPCSKKDYVAIAAIFHSEQERVMPQDKTETGLAVHRALEAKRYLLTARIADYFAANNPRFDRSRFLKACGIQE